MAAILDESGAILLDETGASLCDEAGCPVFAVSAAADNKSHRVKLFLLFGT